jgi:hypothetical protein
MQSEVEKTGLGKILARKGKGFVRFELVRKASDEKASEVDVKLPGIAGRRNGRPKVRENNPAGFAELSHRFLLCAKAGKKDNTARCGKFKLANGTVASDSEVAAAIKEAV